MTTTRPLLSDEDASSAVAQLFSLAIQTQAERVSNPQIALALGMGTSGENRIREWRDPDSGRKGFTVARLLQLLVRMPRVGLAFVDRLLSTAQRLRGEAPDTTMEAATSATLGKLGTAVAALAYALADGRVDEAERETLVATLSQLKRQIDGALVALTHSTAPGGEA